jgi:murein L,D-transpeptidase YcbB/YkuD
MLCQRAYASRRETSRLERRFPNSVEFCTGFYGMANRIGSLMQAAAMVAIAVGWGTPAHAQSAVQFWIEEQGRPAPVYQAYQDQGYGIYPDRGPSFGPWPNWGRRYAPVYPPDSQDAPPHIKVKAPEYRAYVPDRPQTTTLDKVCQIDMASNAAVSPAPAAPTFAQACAVAPSTTLRTQPDVAAALQDYYSTHPHFVWVNQGQISNKARAALAELALSGRYGLSPDDYAVSLPNLSQGDETARLKAMMKFELSLSAKALTYVLDAERGRVDPDRMSDYYDLPRKHVDLVGALTHMAQSNNIVAFLDSRNPDNPRFRALVAALAEAKAAAPQQTIALADNTFIAPGARNPALPAVITAIRQRSSKAFKEKYASTLAHYQGDDAYGPQLVLMVRDFQKEHHLKPDGIIGSNTIHTLKAAAPRDKIKKITLAMERLRWLPSKLGERYVFLNEAAFEVTFVDGNKKPLSMPVVVGKPSRQTYFFTDTIQSIEYNPYWNVPRSILVNEMLPHLYRDPSYLTRHGYIVTNSRGEEIPSSAVDWSAVARNQISVDVKQPPGPRNALGLLKIEFPNTHAIYMHDTPEKSLFNHAQRAFSHGCVRLKYPREMAAALLGKPESYIDQRIAERQNASEKVPGDIPVYLAYFTAWPDQTGTVHYYGDVYGRDGYLSDALAKTEAARKAG